MIGGAELLCWWAMTVGVWLLTLSSVTLPDLLVAAACGLPCAVAARAGRKAVGGVWRPRPGWIRWWAVLPLSVLADTARVFAVAARRGQESHPPGRVTTVHLPRDAQEPVAAARRALATLAVSSTPGTFVIADDPQALRLVVHSLSEKPTLMEKVVSR